MFLVYFDESGDTGFLRGTTKCFVVTALIVHESNWTAVFDHFKSFRTQLKSDHDISLYSELKAYDIINKHSRFERLRNSGRGEIQKWERLIILKKAIDFLASLEGLVECQNICCRKRQIEGDSHDLIGIKEKRFLRTWSYALQRIETHIYYKERRLQQAFENVDISLPDWIIEKMKREYALVFPDNTHNDLLRKLSRRMHTYNYVPYRGASGFVNRTINHILGDPHFQESAHNYYIQFADLISYCLVKHYFPETVPLDYKKLKISHNYRLENLFPRLEPILCKEAAREEPLGVKIFEE